MFSVGSRCVTEFTDGSKAADSFDFDCRYHGSAHPVKVLLARIRERVDRALTKSVLVHIRREETLTRRPRHLEVMAMKEMLTNRILSGLPETEFARLTPLLQPVSLTAGERLCEAGETLRFIYFPENAVLSCQAEMQDGKSAEVGMIGFEGLAAIPALTSSGPAAHSLNVSIGGSALRASTDDFRREMLRFPSLQQSLLTYAGDYVTQVSQRSACAVFHTVEQRFAVWLLLLADRIEEDVIHITQERIADHLGVRRAGITVVASAMQAGGVISYKRGSLRVNDREALRTIACECYGTLSVGQQQTTYM